MHGALQKKSAEGINSRLKLVIKSGKYTLGFKSTMKTLRAGQGACDARRCRALHRAALHAPCRAVLQALHHVVPLARLTPTL